MANRKILILDDSRVTLKMLVQALRSQGYITKATPNLVTFGRLLKEFNPDMILLDLAMPEMAGDLVCRELKEQFPDRKIPVVMMSGLSEGELHLRAKEAGADAYISKKGGFRAFVQEVDNLFLKYSH